MSTSTKVDRTEKGQRRLTVTGTPATVGLLVLAALGVLVALRLLFGSLVIRELG